MPPTSRPTLARRRRRLVPIIDAGFQWTYTIWIVALGAGTASVMGWLLYDANRATTRLLQLSSTPILAASLEQADAGLLWGLVAAVLGLAVLLGVWGLIVTHRISGPCVVVTRQLQELERGSYPEVRPPRRYDALPNLVNALAAAVAALQQRDRAALQALSAIQQGLVNGDPAALGRARMALATEVERLRDQLTA